MKTKNDFINKVQIYSLNDLKSHYRRVTQGHWFDADTMRFFNSRISSDLFYSPKKGLIYFISSEKYNYDSPRYYSVRSYEPKTGDIETIGEFQAYGTLGSAKTAAKKLTEGKI